MEKGQNKLSRRQFLQTGALAAVATGWSQIEVNKKEKIDTKKILNYNSEMRYRQLGNTGIYLSVLSVGGIGIKEPVAQYAIDHGVNLVHMSPTYDEGNAIKVLGKILKEKRDKVYLALKDSFRGEYNDLDAALKALNTDYLDFYMFNRHAPSEVNDPKDVEIFEKLKQQGKVRFAGLTTHKEVKECVAKGIQGDMYTIIMPVLNQPSLEVMNEDLQTAYNKGIGIMAMKTMKGLTEDDRQIAFLKKALTNPAVTTVLKGFSTFDMVNSFLKATQETLTSSEDFSLYRYAQQNRSNNCMMCGECEKACPQGIEISTLLRCKTYYYDQLGELPTARQTYVDIPAPKRYYENCSQCQKCEALCPNGIQIVSQLQETHRLFHSLFG